MSLQKTGTKSVVIAFVVIGVSGGGIRTRNANQLTSSSEKFPEYLSRFLEIYAFDLETMGSNRYSGLLAFRGCTDHELQSFEKEHGNRQQFSIRIIQYFPEHAILHEAGFSLQGAVASRSHRWLGSNMPLFRISG